MKKCGNRLHWEEWAGDIARIAQTHIDRITSILENPKNSAARAEFDKFVSELRDDDLNPSVSDGEVVENAGAAYDLAGVRRALFADYESFAASNPMSQSDGGVLDVFEAPHRKGRHAATFYDSGRVLASEASTTRKASRDRRRAVRQVLPQRLPEDDGAAGHRLYALEVVDFIIHSVNDVLKSKFGQTLGSDGSTSSGRSRARARSSRGCCSPA
ncbi:MAG: hypothetical protein R3D67_22085 [Hyphomicrobiaceae bacterium]